MEATEHPTYRILAVGTGSDQVRMSAQLQTLAGWVEIQAWVAQTPGSATAASRREVLEEAARSAGWVLPEGRWPRPRSDRSLILSNPVPTRFLPIVTAATAQRAALIERLAALDDAWRVVLCDAATRSRAKTDQIATAAGIGRQRLHQIRAEARTDTARTRTGRRAVAAVLGRARPAPTPATLNPRTPPSRRTADE